MIPWKKNSCRREQKKHLRKKEKGTLIHSSDTSGKPACPWCSEMTFLLFSGI
jgi:hypothetical protein